MQCSAWSTAESSQGGTKGLCYRGRRRYEASSEHSAWSTAEFVICIIETVFAVMSSSLHIAIHMCAQGCAENYFSYIFLLLGENKQEPSFISVLFLSNYATG